MPENEDARLLLAAARNDLKALEGMVNDRETFSDEVFGFHAQQAAEKSLKAWISTLGSEYLLTHSLSVLLLQLEDLGCNVQTYRSIVDLSPFGVAFRYTILDEAEGSLDRAAILEAIRGLYERVDEQCHC